LPCRGNEFRARWKVVGTKSPQVFAGARRLGWTVLDGLFWTVTALDGDCSGWPVLDVPVLDGLFWDVTVLDVTVLDGLF